MQTAFLPLSPSLSSPSLALSLVPISVPLSVAATTDVNYRRPRMEREEETRREERGGWHGVASSECLTRRQYMGRKASPPAVCSCWVRDRSPDGGGGGPARSASRR